MNKITTFSNLAKVSNVDKTSESQTRHPQIEHPDFLKVKTMETSFAFPNNKLNIS